MEKEIIKPTDKVKEIFENIIFDEIEEEEKILRDKSITKDKSIIDECDEQ